jgi:hypothetical protein
MVDFMPPIARDHVQHHIHAPAVGGALDDFDKVLGLVIDCAFSAQRHAGRAFLGGAGGGEYAMAHGPCHLDGGHADAAAAALHQEGFVGRQVRAHEDVTPHGKERLGH